MTTKAWNVIKHAKSEYSSQVIWTRFILSCQPSVTVTSFFVYKVINDLLSIDHLCINRINTQVIHASGVYKLMFY